MHHPLGIERLHPINFLDDIDHAIRFALEHLIADAKNVRTGERVNRTRQKEHGRFAFATAWIFRQKIPRHFFNVGKITRVIGGAVRFFAAGDVRFHLDAFARDQADAAKIEIIVK